MSLHFTNKELQAQGGCGRYQALAPEPELKPPQNPGREGKGEKTESMALNVHSILGSQTALTHIISFWPCHYEMLEDNSRICG